MCLILNLAFERSGLDSGQFKWIMVPKIEILLINVSVFQIHPQKIDLNEKASRY